MIGELFYTLFIWPIRFILEFFFVLFIRIFGDPGSSVIFLSIVVNTLTLPIYIIADRWQKEERELQKRMKKKLIDIRAVFRGDERQMIINTYYRQMGYSPVFVVKASVGLLLQIPFFIAAYQFLSHTSLLADISFFFLRNLSSPDGLLRLSLPVFGMTVVNIMPILMTGFNLVSSLIYAKDLGKREIIQLVAMALVFLVLLYNSPSGLVLYWTMNNIYSLVKNAAQRVLKNPGRALQAAVSIFAVVFLFLIWSGEASVERYRFLFTGIAAGLIVLPFIWRRLVQFFGTFYSAAGKSADYGPLYFSSVLLLFLLLGLLNPAQILSASLTDFEVPWSFMGRTVLQGFAFFVLIPLFIRVLAPEEVRRVSAALAAALAVNCLVCYFALSASYGVMDRNFKLDETERLLHAFPLWISIAVPLGAIACTTVFIAIKKEKIFTVLLQAACVAILVLTFMNFVSLGRQSAELNQLNSNETSDGESLQFDGLTKKNSAVLFPLSTTEQNVFIVFLDRAQGTAMTDALEYMPSLQKGLDGFTFYPNTLSFGSCTVTGVPAMLGGYDYTPLAINARKNELLVDKVNEALTRLPRLFGEAGLRVSITDPVIANMQSVPDTSIFRDLPNVSARVLSGKLANRFRTDFPDTDEQPSDSFDFDILFRYGLFRAAPPALRYGIHYKGQWWRERAYNSYGRAVAEFSSLYYWPELCSVDSGPGTLNIFMNAVTHESGAYGADLFPQSKPVLFDDAEIERYGSEGNAEYMYTFLSAMKQLVKWLDYLKQQGVYDNTTIIVVSDHGGHYHSRHEAYLEMENYNPLLLIKEPASRGILAVSQEFMTHADTPVLAAEAMTGRGGITGEKIAALAGDAKGGSLWAVDEVSSQPLRHGPYEFNLTGIRELRGKEMFRKESWGEWER
jgi:YidC/Oxa1 family membrane protein insertase